MELISRAECQEIVEKACPDKPLTLLRYHFQELENHVPGYLSSSKKLVIEFVVGESDRRQLSFFVKMLPEGNEFHEEYIRCSGGFVKEVFYFNRIQPNLDVWSERKVVPECYLAIQDKIVVLQLLSDYRVKDVQQYWSEQEIKSAIESLAVLHSSSLVCETKNGIDLKSVWGEYFFDSLIIRKEGHLGFRHVTLGIKAIKALVETYFSGLDGEAKRKVFSLYDSLPELILPSSKFRNVVSHGDLHSGNVMLAQTSTGEILAKIVDFQLLRFNPPALDLLMLIYLTTDLSQDKVRLEQLTNYYYDCVSNNVTKFGLDVSKELPLDEYVESLTAYNSVALALALLFQQYINLPSHILDKIMAQTSELKKFVLQERTELVLSSFRDNQSYQNKLSATISLLFNSCKM